MDALRDYRMDITALQEMKWMGKGEREDKKNQCDIYYSCHPSKREFGVGFAVRGKTRFCVTRWTPINERLCILRVKARFYNISIICIHAPTNDTDDEVKDIFYEQLDRAYGSLPAHDMKLVIGDFNAKVGKEHTYAGTIGGHSIHNITTNNGMKMINFAAMRDMVVSSTYFPHPRIHLETWVSNDGVTKNQIDHVLCDTRHATSILDVRTMRGANVDSDHHLVRARVRCRISSKRQTNRNQQRQFNTDALLIPATAERYSSELTEKLRMLPEEADIDAHWKQCASVVISTATEILGMKQPPRQCGWRDDEYDRAVAEKKNAYQKSLQLKTRAAKEAFKTKRREVVKLAKQKKRQFERDQVEKLEVLRDRNQARKFYQNVNKQRKGFVPTTANCNDENGNLITNKQEVLARWEGFFSKLLNGDDNRVTPQRRLPEPPFQNTEDVPPPTRAEVNESIQRMKNNKSAGIDGIPAELFKAAGTSFNSAFHQLLTKIWNEETMPDDWKTSIICPIHKKGDRRECKNYRGISLLNIAYKILASIMCERLKPHVIRIIGPYQCGFMPGRSTTDQLFTLRQILEKTHEFQVDTYHLFIDFKQAYDTPTRDELFKAMNLFGIPSKLINLCRMTLTDTRSCVRVGGTTSKTFPTIRGFRQGDALSCSFFNILLELIMKVANINTRNIIYTKSSQILGYADDLDVVGRSKEDVTRSFLAIEKAAKDVGLQVNEDKTKHLLSSRSEASHNRLGQNIKIGHYQFEAVRNFIYLGSEVTHDNDVSSEIKRRIMLANKCLFGLSKMMRSKHLTRRTKIKLYHELIQPVLLYGAECWNLTSSDEELLMVFERKILRMIYGPIQEYGEWRIRYNHELYQLYQFADVSKRIRTKRLRWAGHVARMDDDLPAKQMFSKNPGGTRRRGRQRTRWVDLVNKDAEELGIPRWRETATSREDWSRRIHSTEST